MRLSFCAVTFAAIALAGCAHEPSAQPETSIAPTGLKANDQHAKVVFKMVTTRAIASFSAGKAGNLVKVGKVYNEASVQQYPGFTQGLMRGLTQSFGEAAPVRELLVNVGETIELQGSTGWATNDGMYQRTASCGPLTNVLTAQANKTYLVEFDLQNGLCTQALYDITAAGQKDLIAKGHS